MDSKYIRNFSIIAHIDHGKSTIADAILKFTGALTSREEKNQFLDNMDLERERGITIKAQTVRIPYKAKDGHEYILNLIDTPGHVDFSYEVSRSLAACEGALLVVDAAQGVEAQTLANVYLALENDLELIPVLNKIDLPAADPDGVIQQIEDVIGLETDNAVLASAKTGEGIEEILEAVVRDIPAPDADSNKALRALIIDSWFDSYQGIVVLVRVRDGKMAKKDKIRFHATGVDYEVIKIGTYSPFPKEVNELYAGEVGFLICGIKDIREVKVGDTIQHTKGGDIEPLPGFQKVQPMVFSGLFPVDSSDFENLREAIEKLALNDSSLTYEVESSSALGFGMRCGFLGLLHMEIIQERLEREFHLDLITTAPSVVYRVYKNDDTVLEIEKPSDLPEVTHIKKIEEPMIRASLHTPSEFLGNLIKLCEDKRGIQEKMEYISEQKVMLVYQLPLNEIVMDFYDRLKSITKGYASMDYEIIGFQESDMVKMDILINGDPVDALSFLVHRTKAQHRGRELVKKLKEVIHRQQFKIAIQAAIGAKIIARETLSALRKDVTAKCYGGDITRKRKLLEKQKEGKKRMKQIGSVEIPQKAFLAILKVED
tara:strand:- start:6770 stop:8569 length:1800 start_codon:yes stop_codon:yes gene_type:complete